MSPFPITSEPFDLGRGVSVEFSFDGGRVDCEWSPDVPRGRHGRQFLPAYTKARNAFLATVAQRLGANIAVVDLPAGDR